MINKYAGYLKNFRSFIYPERNAFSDSYDGELHYQCSRVIFPASIICIFAWINYIKVDAILNPDEPVIVLLRYGLIFVSLIIFIIQFFRSIKLKSMYLILLLGLYLEVATGIITGLSKADSAYMGGYLFVLVIPVVAPVKKWFMSGILIISILSFLSIGFYKGMEFSNLRAQYQLNDLIVAFCFSFVFIFILDKIRYKTWVQSKQVSVQSEQLRLDKDKTANIINKSKELVKYVSEAVKILDNFSGNVDNTVKTQSNIISQSKIQINTVLESFDSLIKRTNKQMEINSEGRSLSKNIRNVLIQTATSSKTAVEDAHKIKLLSDECDNKLRDTRNVIENLKEESSQIAKISNAINDIADQTNMLSLNASIESARAGEHGRGFSVVASEISKLADISIKSANDIGDIVKKSVNRISEASNQIQDTTSVLKKIMSFLDDNKNFLIEFEKLISSQDRDVEFLINQMVGILEFTEAISEIILDNSKDIVSTRDTIDSIENFYLNLLDMSNTLVQLSEELGIHIGSLENTLSS